MPKPSKERSGMEANENEVQSGFPFTMFSVLADPDRVEILSYLLDQPTPVTIGELVDTLAEANGDSNGENSDTEREKITIALHHNHLPKLSESGVIGISSDEEYVTLLQPAPQLKPYLELAVNPPT